MNNAAIIILCQYLPAFVNRKLDGFRQVLNKLLVKKLNGEISFIENIDYFEPEKQKTKHALISLESNAWLTALKEYPTIKYFNTTGFTYEIIKILNENEYLVDIIDIDETNFIPTKKYNLYIGHGGNCKKIIDNLDDGTTLYQYASGAYWKGFNIESEERYRNFYKRKNITKIISFMRSINNEGEDYLTQKAKKVLLVGNMPRTIETFGTYKEKVISIGWTAYIQTDLIPERRDFEAGKKNFLYVGGTGGNVQKGLDLLIETFARIPELNLYIYCKVEKDIYDAYKKELSLPNIKYIYHYRFGHLRKRLRMLFGKINFTIHAPINTGIGTAFLGSMGLGFIPVGYVDLPYRDESVFLTESYAIDDLIRCVKLVSQKPVEWFKNASELTLKRYQEYWSIENIQKTFNHIINEE
jgi:hypothetical protein